MISPSPEQFWRTSFSFFLKFKILHFHLYNIANHIIKNNAILKTKGRGEEESCQVIGTPRSIRLYTTRLPNYIVNTMPNSISVLLLVNTTQSCIPQTAKPNWFKLNGRLLLIDYMHRSYYDCKINVPLIDYMHRSYYDCKINVS